MKKMCLAALLTLILIFVFIPAVHAQSPQETLKQYISDLQKNPNDTALREKIIKHVQMMKPEPAIPMEVEKFEGRAEFAFKNAKSTKSEADFLDAAKEYEKAPLIAPWVSAYYFNQGVAFEMAGKPKAAKHSFEFYLLAAPNAQDARDIRKRIAGLEYATEKAAKESSPAAIAEKKQNTFEDLLRKIDGRRYFYTPTDIIDIKGRVFVPANLAYPQYKFFSHDIRDRVSTHPMSRQPNSAIPWAVEFTFIISEDGDTITWRTRLSDGTVNEHIYLWKK